MRRPLLGDRPSHLFNHVAEMHAGRARRLACPAVQTSEHVLNERIGYLCAAFIKRSHQINAAARRVHLAAEDPIRGARREAQTTMDAVQVERSFLFVFA